MPPKKATTSKAKATTAKSPVATAAAERPRRAAAKDAPAATPAKKATTKKAATNTATTTTPATKKRGRPAKTEPADVVDEPPKKRGRPAKAAQEPEPAAEAPKKRGRPSKNATAANDTPAVPEAETAPPKRRGHPPKGGETTQIAEDDPAAAEQLEEELVDAAEAEETEVPSKRAPPAKKSKAAVKGKGRKPKQTAEEDPVDTAAAVDEAADSAVEGQGVEENEAGADDDGKSYWLMKAEQIDREETLGDGSVFNTKFTIDDLREKAGPEPWDGVRNPTACKNMRAMKAGDLAFFYASGAKGKAVQPGIVGIMEIVKEHEADMSAFDETSPYYVKNAKTRGTKENPRWSLVHVEFRKKLSKPVGLKELQQFSRNSGVLANMQEFKAARLSVSKVSPQEWNFIVDNLIEGYEEDGEPAVASKKETSDDALPTVATATEDDIMTGVPGINGVVSEEPVLPTSETAAASIEVNATSRAGSLKPSSRPTSRAPSRAPSRSGSKAPSRQASLAPPRARSRGRSRTPASRGGSVKPMQGVTEGTEKMETVQE